MRIALPIRGLSASAAFLGVSLAAACGDSADPSSGDTAVDSATGTCPTSLYDGTSCADFLVGCYVPDTSGSCVDNGTSLSWSDGHLIERVGQGAGLYRPGDASPCIALGYDVATSTAVLTRASDGAVLRNADLGGGRIQITCPAGEVIDTTSNATMADNLCRGLVCP
jgi:hypothetical protein